MGQAPALQPGVGVTVGVLQLAGLQLGVTDGVVVGQAPALQPCGVAVAAAVGCGVAVICGRGKLLGATC